MRRPEKRRKEKQRKEEKGLRSKGWRLGRRRLDVENRNPSRKRRKNTKRMKSSLNQSGEDLLSSISSIRI